MFERRRRQARATLDRRMKPKVFTGQAFAIFIKHRRPPIRGHRRGSFILMSVPLMEFRLHAEAGIST